MCNIYRNHLWIIFPALHSFFDKRLLSSAATNLLFLDVSYTTTYVNYSIHKLKLSEYSSVFDQ